MAMLILVLMLSTLYNWVWVPVGVRAPKTHEENSDTMEPLLFDLYWLYQFSTNFVQYFCWFVILRNICLDEIINSFTFHLQCASHSNLAGYCSKGINHYQALNTEHQCSYVNVIYGDTTHHNVMMYDNKWTRWCPSVEFILMVFECILVILAVLMKMDSLEDDYLGYPTFNVLD